MDSSYSKPQHQKERTRNLVIDNELSSNNSHEVDSVTDSDTTNSSSDILNKKKWKCIQCTYENWPSALKCTICLTSKSISSVNNQINTKLRTSSSSSVNNNLNNNNHGNNRSLNTKHHVNKNNANTQHQLLKKRNDSNNSRKSNESKIRLKFEPWHDFSSSQNNENLDKNFIASSYESLNESVNAINKTVKDKKKTMVNDIYRIGDLLTKNCKFLL